MWGSSVRFMHSSERSHNNYITMNPKKWQWILRRKEKQTASSTGRKCCLFLILYNTRFQIKNHPETFPDDRYNQIQIKKRFIHICTLIRQLADIPFGLVPLALRHQISLGLRLLNVSKN